MEQNDEKHKFTRQEIEQHLQSALAAATPNVWAKLDLSVPQDKPQKRSMLLQLEHQVRRWGVAAACICLLAGGGIYHYEYVQVASVVGIDVNPSLKISLNRRDKVLKAEALNPEGEIVLEGELRGKTLETALDQVVDSLVAKGYLKEGQQEQAVLVSVSGTGRKNVEKVKTAATANMEQAIAQKQVSAVVYDQTIQVTKELEELAETYQVSVGKAGFVEQLVQENEVLNQDAQGSYGWMMNQPMEAIAQEISEHAYAVSTQVNVVRVEPADKASKQESRKESQEKVFREESASKDTGADEAEENSSAENRFEKGSPEREEESRSEAVKEGNPREQTKDNHEDTRENPKKPFEAEETKQEGARKDKDAEESQETADKPDEKQDASENENRNSDRKESQGEATSSTVGAEISQREDAKNEDRYEEEEADPEKVIPGENSSVTLVEYGQPLKDNGNPEELAVGGELPDYSREVPSDKINPDESGAIEEDRHLEAEIPEDGRDRTEEETIKDTEAENRTGKEENTEGTEAEKPTAAESKETETLTGTEEQGTEILTGAGNQEAETSASEENQEVQIPTEAENQEAEIPAGSENQEAETSAGSENREAETLAGPENQEAQTSAGSENREAQTSAGSENREAQTPAGSENQEAQTSAASENQEAQTPAASENSETESKTAEEAGNKAGEQDAGREEIRKDESGEELQENESAVSEPERKDETLEEEDKSRTATQIIRVKVETKEWKEPEKPVFASQFLGFSHRRLLSRGPGAFDFILADPEKLKTKKEDLEENTEENAEDEENDGLDKAEPKSDPGAEEDVEPDGDWEMGEWLHIGPGYLP